MEGKKKTKKKDKENDTKSFQIVMEPRVHASLKSKANMFNINIGEMIENLLIALEKRIFRVQVEIEEGNINPEVARDGSTEKRIIELLLKNDVGELSDRQFKVETKKLIKALLKEKVAPELMLKGISNE